MKSACYDPYWCFLLCGVALVIITTVKKERRVEEQQKEQNIHTERNEILTQEAAGHVQSETRSHKLF